MGEVEQRPFYTSWYDLAYYLHIGTYGGRPTIRRHLVRQRGREVGSILVRIPISSPAWLTRGQLITFGREVEL